MKPGRRRIFVLVFAVLFVPVLGGFILRHEVKRAYHVFRLFDADRIVENFRSMDQHFSVKWVERSAKPSNLPVELRPLTAVYPFQGRMRSVQEFLDETWTTGLLVIHDDRIVHESYYRGQTRETRTISWSLAKSFVSALLGIAHQEGAIPDLRQAMDAYAPDLKGSGYEGVAVEDVLEMSAPIAFNEDYANPISDINRLGYALAWDSPIDAYMRSLKRQKGKQQGFHYISPNTQALAMVIRGATGRDFTSYFQEKLWSKLGTESDAFWIQDSRGIELVFGGLNATLRDYGRLGLLYLHRGKWNDQRIVDEQWIERSVRPGKPYLLPKNSPRPSSWGYGYHWWIPYATDGDYCAIGIYHQYIYVNPKLNVIIVKTSADPQYNVNGAYKEVETMAMFRAIAHGLNSEKKGLSRRP
jgi:CubicO group peptidase (beta-lactamase class C family)